MGSFSQAFLLILFAFYSGAHIIGAAAAEEDSAASPIRIAKVLSPSSSGKKSHTKSSMRTEAVPPLTYRGGAIIQNPRVYLVFWGSQWNNNDPYGEATIISNFMRGVGGSAWLNTVTQYCSGVAVGSTSCTGGSKYIVTLGTYNVMYDVLILLYLSSAYVNSSHPEPEQYSVRHMV